MHVVPQGQLLINYLRGSFPFQTSPTISLPDYAIHATLGNAADLQGLVPDPVAGCLYAKPLFVPHNQRVTTGTVKDQDQYVNAALPDWTWDTLTGTSGQNFLGSHFGHQTLDSVDASTALAAGGSVTLNRSLTPKNDHDPDHSVQGFFCFLNQSAFISTPSSSYDVQWKIGADTYSLKVTNTELAKLRVFKGSGPTATDLAPQLKMGSAFTQAIGSNSPGGALPIVIEVLFVNSTLLLKFGGQQVPYSYRIYGLPSPLITQVKVVASGYTTLGVEVHPMKFVTSGTMRSNPQDLGFNPQTTPYYYVSGISGTTKLTSGNSWNVGFPSGSQVKVTRTGLPSDESQQYDLLVTNPTAGTYAAVNYADRTAAVTRVVIHVDGTWASAPTPATPVIPKRLTEVTTFDPNGLTVSQGLSFTLDNFHGQWYGQAGNLAVGLTLGYQQPATAQFPRFTGKCGRYRYERPTTNRSTISFECDTLMSVLAEQQIFTPPLMDGWNHYYALAYLAQMAGFTTSQLAFAALVPSDPFSAAAGDPAPYFLPFGNGMRPWTPKGRESTILELMNYIRQPTGFMLFFDSQGYLRYEPWLPPSLTPAKRTFTEGAAGVDGASLNEFWGFTLESSVDEVRNQVLLLGVDPYDPRWSIIVSKREDTASIYAAPGSEPPNYVGYKKPFVWVDSRFVNSTFTAQAADRLYQMLRLPGLHARFTTWLQPDLYPMDVIYIAEQTTGAAGVAFYVMQTINNWEYSGGKQVCTTTVLGKFLL